MNPEEAGYIEKAGLTQSMLAHNGIQITSLSFDEGTVLFRPGDSCQAFLILCEGSIRVEMTAKSGRDLTLYRMKPSESCILTTSALMNEEPYYAQGIAESTIRALALSSIDFNKAIACSQPFSQYVLKSYTKRLSSIIQLIDRMTVRDVMADVCLYLQAHIRVGQPLSITQAEIANDIGTAREVVGRKLRQLAAMKVVALKRGTIELIDREKLKLYL